MLEVELVETGVLRTEDATHTRIVFKFVPLTSDQEQRSGVTDRLMKNPQGE